jgi:serine/threonine protein kinase
VQPEKVGPYTLLRSLGSGPLGRVALARTDKGARVALKVFRPELAGFPGFGERLRQEIHVAARVRGPRVAGVVDADPDAEVPWLATEYVEGPPLHEVLAAQGALDADRARQLGIGLAEALLTIHAAGAVHGDLKPANVLLAPDGPRVTDVGIARAAAATALTRGGALVGTLGYLAPEQVVDGRARPASDVFALGSVLLLAATWRRPFGDGDAISVLHRVLRGDADLHGVPAEVAGVVRACLRCDPGGRPGPEQVRAALIAPAPVVPAQRTGSTAAEAPEPARHRVPAVAASRGGTGTHPPGALRPPPTATPGTPPPGTLRTPPSTATRTHPPGALDRPPRAAPEAGPRAAPEAAPRTRGRARRVASAAAVTAMLAGVFAVATADTVAVPPPEAPFAELGRQWLGRLDAAVRQEP